MHWNFGFCPFSRTFVMKKKRPQTELNRIDILRRCYRMMAMGAWDAISVSDLEKGIDRTRGAIFYFNKNKEELFVNMIDELFLPVFKLSKDDRTTLKRCSAKNFFAIYKTPFERVCNDLRINYRVQNPSHDLFNILIQAQRHYKDFRQVINAELQSEIDFIGSIIGSNRAVEIDIHKIYTNSAGRIFLDSFS